MTTAAVRDSASRANNILPYAIPHRPHRIPVSDLGAYKNVRLSKASASWPTVPGVVTAADRAKVGWRTQPRVTFSYSMDGKAYSSSKVSFAAGVSKTEIEPILSRYPLSRPVEVHDQPGNPEVAILETGPNRNARLRQPRPRL
jgi:hypothetical protein